MNKNLRDYVKVYNLMSQETCDETVRQLNASKFEEHKLYNPRTKAVENRPGLANTYYGHLDIMPKLMTDIYSALSKYVLEDIKFDWFIGWEGYTIPRFNRYTKGQSLYNHCDHIHDIFDGQRKGIPKLSCVGVLNEDFKGGEFVMFEDEIIQTKPGDIIVFPSMFLFPHKVNEVTEGTRYTFASWCW